MLTYENVNNIEFMFIISQHFENTYQLILELNIYTH